MTVFGPSFLRYGIGLLCLLFGIAAHSSSSIETRQISVGMTSDAGNGSSDAYLVSGNDRYVVFVSTATNLVPNGIDTNQGEDIFLYDRDTDQVTLVSHRAGNPASAANARSIAVDISDDGRWVLFESTATDLVPGQVDSNGYDDAFLFDRDSGEVRLLSRTADSAVSAANAGGNAIALSGDGRYAIFWTYSTNVLDGVVDANGLEDGFIHEIATTQTRLLSHKAEEPMVTANGGFGWAAISRDGTWVAYSSSAGNVIDPDAPRPGVWGISQVYLLSLASDELRLLSHIAGQPSVPVNEETFLAGMSADGSVIAMRGKAPNLATGQVDTLGYSDLFAYSRLDGTTKLISHAASSSYAAANGASQIARVSADGSMIAFESKATDLVAGFSDTNATWDVFLTNLSTGTTTLVSRAGETPASSGSWTSRIQALSTDGRFLLLSSVAQDLIQGVQDIQPPPTWDVFLYDHLNASLKLLSHPALNPLQTTVGQSYGGALSSDGDFAVFISEARDIDDSSNDASARTDVFLYERTEAISSLLSKRSALGAVAADASSRVEKMSAKGDFLLFESSASDLAPNQSPDPRDRELFLAATADGSITPIASVSPETTGGVDYVMSGDARWVAFTSSSRGVIPGLEEPQYTEASLYLFDRLNNAIRLVSRSHDSSTRRAHGAAPSISADGRWVAYVSHSTEIVPGSDPSDYSTDVFLYDRIADSSIQVSSPAITPNPNLDRNSGAPLVSDDGVWVAFTSGAKDLVPGAIYSIYDYCSDVYRYHRPSATIQLVSHRASSTQVAANGCSRALSLSADGNELLLSSSANNIAASIVDQNGEDDLFVFVGDTGRNELVSRSATTANRTANARSSDGEISAGGRWITYLTTSNDVVSGIVDPDVFHLDAALFDRFTGQTKLLSLGMDGVTAQGADAIRMTRNAKYVSFSSRGASLVVAGQDENTENDAFLFDRCARETELVSPRQAVLPTDVSNATYVLALSEDGKRLALTSDSMGLVTNVTESEKTTDVFVVTRHTDVLFIDGLELEGCN